MKKKTLGLLTLGAVLAPVIVLAQFGAVTPSAPPTYTATQIMALLPRITAYVFGFLLAIVVLCVIIAAYLYVTAAGNPETVSKANKWLMYALIGLAVAVAARGIIALVYTILGAQQP
jgi:FtsH-binding integral membrane protein